MPKQFTYNDAGVSIEANARWVSRIQSVMRSTHNGRVAGVPGAFAGMFRFRPEGRALGDRYIDPVLVSCADGVGTKVLLGIRTGRLRGLGIDLVAMNVNDLVTCGAEPLFFLDYLAVHKIEPDALAEIIDGVADGCRQAGCALLGGETAEMPDLYRRGHFDLAGFAVGVAERRRVIDGSRVAPGDVLIGLASSGIHSNGYTLVRKLISEHRLKLDDRFGGSPAVAHGHRAGRVADRAALADVLLAPTRIYVRAVLGAIRHYRTRMPITGMAHITGGGLRENVARMLPGGCTAEIDTRSWTPPPVFPFLESLGVSRREMFRVFNMGIGFVLAVRPRYVSGVVKALEAAGEFPIPIGRITRGRRTVRLLSRGFTQ